MRACLAPGVAPSAALAVALAASGCNVLNPESCHDLAATVQPLEPELLDTTYLPWTELVTTQVVIKNGPYYGYYTCQGRGYVVQPIERVYAALSDPTTTYLQNDPNGGTILDLATQTDIEPVSVASVSFHVFYKNPTGLRTPPRGGTTHIQKLDGSIVSRPVAAAELPPGASGATSLEMIYWLEADTQDQGNCNGTLQDQFNGIVRWLNTH